MVDSPDGDFVSAQQACELLGVKPATLYAYVSRGLLQSYRPGRTPAAFVSPVGAECAARYAATS